jgi:polyhydroxyalkanoate synthesis regulator phasin
MPKKTSAKKRVKSGTDKPNAKRHEINIEKTLIENFVALQKVMANLSSKFDNLAGQISKLLELFEISAKALAEKEVKIEQGEADKKIVEKIDKLLDQNKIIARGLTLLHEPQAQMPVQQQGIPAPLPRPRQPGMQPPGLKRQARETGGYEKSISSQNEEPGE